MPDPLRHVHAGEPLAIDADTWNALVDAARAYRAGHAGPPSAAPVHLPLSSALHCLVKYDASSGSVLPPFSVLRIAGTLTDVDADPHGHQGRPAYLGAVPAAAADQVVVTTEPIRGGKIGRAAVSGLAVCTLDVSDTGHRFAAPVAGDSTKFASSATPGYPVVWQEAGTGEVWAVILLGPVGAGRPLAGILSEASGAASGVFQTVDAGGNWSSLDPAITNAIRPMRMDVSTAGTGPGVHAVFTPKAQAVGLLWESEPGTGVYAFLPVQAADYGYAGYVTSAAQTFGGDKSFQGTVNVDGDFDESGPGGTYLTVGTAALRVKALPGGDLRVTMGYAAGDPDVSAAYFLQVDGGGYFNGQVGASGSGLFGGEVVAGDVFRLDGSGYGGSWGDGELVFTGSAGGAAKLFYGGAAGARQVWALAKSAGSATVRFEVDDQVAAPHAEIGNIIAETYRTYDGGGGSVTGGSLSVTVGMVTTDIFLNGLYVGGPVLTADALADALDDAGGTTGSLSP